MKVLITAGPTREKIDAVRFISNRSTGKMGYALAAAARDAGCDVTLISGPTALADVEGVRMIRVESAAEMAEQVFAVSDDCDAVIMAAAVADYRPAVHYENKMKKTDGPLSLVLERTADILAGLGKCKKAGQRLIGFAAESEDLIKNAAGKMQRKNLDWIAGNLVSDGFATEDNTVILMGKDNSSITIGPAAKAEVARKIVEVVLK